MKRIRVNWAAAMTTFMILAGVGGFVFFGATAISMKNLWWLIGLVPSIACVGVGVGIMAEA